MTLSGEEFMKRFHEGSLRESTPDICGICGKPITDKQPGEIEQIDCKPVHADCYFDKLSEHVAQNPITTPSELIEWYWSLTKENQCL